MFHHVDNDNRRAGTDPGSAKRHFTDEELKAADQLLRKGEPVSDGIVYDEPVGKQDPRTVAMYRGWYLRQELALLLHPSDATARTAYLKTVRARTWADGKGFRFAVVAK